ncbi:MAG: zinc-binding dehydrogenase, partial [Gammaproteobacteria bacterium]|nr:zinc-binding dehydrogenase [Gammaproteobacteria bacterium]
HGVTPDQGEILVTGAAGGVGSVATSILAKLGYTVIGATGRPEQADYLKSLGAAGTVDRGELSEKGKPLGKERWAGAVDAVGGQTLANVLAQIKYGGTVAACGNASGFDLPATVMPFILRGVTLAGIDSVYRSKEDRIEAWGRLAEDLDMQHIEAIMSEIGLANVIATANDQMDGKVRGRVVVDVNA